jgi:hypothetical protein
MMNIFRSLLGVLLSSSIFCSAAPPPEKTAEMSQEVVSIAEVFGKDKVTVKISVHEADIGKPGDEWPKKRLTNCTYTRYPCSLVDLIEVSINGEALFVGRSVFADLADISDATVAKKKGRFVLTLHGGDASEAIPQRSRSIKARSGKGRSQVT